MYLIRYTKQAEKDLENIKKIHRNFIMLDTLP